MLFLGENWFGSCARAASYALRRLGCDVTEIDGQTYFPPYRSRFLRAALRLLRPWSLQEYNREVLRAADTYSPDLVLAFKGAFLTPGTLRALRERGALTCNYFPDTSAFAHGDLIPQTLPHYDCIFATKPFWERDTRVRIKLGEVKYLPHGYDPDVHRPQSLTPEELKRFAHDVVLIATYRPQKEEVLGGLLDILPDLDLCIWGEQWGRCRDPRLKSRAKGHGLVGTAYAKAIGAARICLAIMSGADPGSSQGDETSTRTFEIPASGGFMLHERTRELLGLFEDGKEVATFATWKELAEKVTHYLNCESNRKAIANAGHKRCVPAYSYDARMCSILDWYASARNRNS